MTRPCRACDGTGKVRRLDNPRGFAVEFLAPGYAQGIVYCAACLGSGRISERIPAADAMADAETLRGSLSTSIAFHPLHKPYVANGIRAALSINRERGVWPVVFRARDAARAAFRAVPGLRGE